MEHLDKVYQRHKKLELAKPFDQNKYTNDDLFFLKGRLLVFAVYELIRNENPLKSKELFSNIAEVSLVLIKNGLIRIEYAIHEICFTLISDNPIILERFANYRPPVVNEDCFGFYFNSIIQNILIDNTEEALRLLDSYKKSNHIEGSYSGLTEYFEGVITKSIEKTKIGLQQLITTQNKRKNDDFLDTYISIELVALAKLAISKGIDVNPKHKLIPVNILPNKPLSKYPALLNV